MGCSADGTYIFRSHISNNHRGRAVTRGLKREGSLTSLMTVLSTGSAVGGPVSGAEELAALLPGVELGSISLLLPPTTCGGDTAVLGMAKHQVYYGLP